MQFFCKNKTCAHWAISSTPTIPLWKSSYSSFLTWTLGLWYVVHIITRLILVFELRFDHGHTSSGFGQQQAFLVQCMLVRGREAPLESIQINTDLLPTGCPLNTEEDKYTMGLHWVPCFFTDSSYLEVSISFLHDEIFHKGLELSWVGILDSQRLTFSLQLPDVHTFRKLREARDSIVFTGYTHRFRGR